MNIILLSEADDFLRRLSFEDSARIKAHLRSFEQGLTGGLAIKTLRGKIRELIVGEYRVVFFIAGPHAYVIEVFRKKSKKTPRRIIERAEQILKKARKIRKRST